MDNNLLRRQLPPGVRKRWGVKTTVEIVEAIGRKSIRTGSRYQPSRQRPAESICEILTRLYFSWYFYYLPKVLKIL
jgi:hypothetical protein